ncbi:acyltransferase [Corallococcus sp. CA053C]|uniref:acyltransferase family protein n=1 Tax=Corallococcus sp. CA053C TaxID=2316732 RepID=UPI001315814C|nr:acyltransferase [Corallococcus sp. CA053C]
MTRSRTLDILRTFAVLLVLGRHIQMPLRGVDAWVVAFLDVWQRGGWVGVDLFFVLSGFLVSGLLFKEHQRSGALSVQRFLIRRGLKIYPPFYALLGVTVAFALLGLPGYTQLTSGGLLRELLFVQNYRFGLWNHTWSLAVEEHFYLLLPVLLVLLLKGNRGRSADPFGALPRVFLAVALACLGMRLFTTFRSPFNYYVHDFPTHLRIDSLLFGVLLAYYQHYRPERFASITRDRRALLFVMGCACFIPAFQDPHEESWYLTTVGFSLFYLGAGLLVCAVHDLQPRPTWPVRLLSFLGARSYSIYLWHMPVAVWGRSVLLKVLPVWNWYVYAVMYFLGTFLLGLGMHWLLEGPVLRLRDRFFPSSPPVASVPASMSPSP